jgi:hypothetical protein
MGHPAARCATVAATAVAAFVVGSVAAAPNLPRDVRRARNPAGLASTYAGDEALDFTGPFFQDLGTNGRRCVTCHQPSEGWTVSAAGVRARFDATEGTDPIFRLVDGATSPLADVSTPDARREAYGMLLSRAVIRVERPIPAGAEFELLEADDPYGHASASGLSLFRRPLPTTNLRFLSTVMWDGREVDPLTPMTIANSAEVNAGILRTSLLQQALDATVGHAEAAQPPTDAQRAEIVDFEMRLATAQLVGRGPGALDVRGALGGPRNIADLPFHIGINDNVADPDGPFDAHAMTLYDAWRESTDARRRSVARGQDLFDSKPIEISDVKGLNDNPYFGSPATLTGTCTTCHDSPNVGNHSLAVALDIGVAAESRRTPDMPLYTLRKLTTGETTRTTDPGLALSTGRWKDIGRFKGPVLRGLAARAPYFHDGSAADLDAVLDFYEERFGVDFTDEERADLIAFLEAL